MPGILGEQSCSSSNKCLTIKAPPPPPTGPRGKKGPQGNPGVNGQVSKCFPIENFGNPEDSPVQPGDIVAVGKGLNKATVHKLLCEQWEWAAAIDSPTNEEAAAVAVDNCGNIYVAGWSGTGDGVPLFYNAAFNGTTSNSFISGRDVPPGDAQFVVGKISPSGVWEWTAAVAGILRSGSAVSGPSLSTDSCGNVYVAGITDSNSRASFYDTLPSGNTSNEVSIYGKLGSGTGLFVAKLSPNGEWKWVAAIDSLEESGDRGPRVATDQCGNIYVAGTGVGTPYYYNALPSGNTSLTSSLVGKTADVTQIYIGKLKPTGVWEWSAAMDSLQLEILPAIAADGCGNVYLAGTATTASPKYYNTDPNTGNTSSTVALQGQVGTGEAFIFVGKLGNDGFWQWSATVDSDGTEALPTITTDCHGNIYVAGIHTPSSDNLKFYDGITNLVSVTGPVLDGTNIFLAKLKSTGKWEWVASVYGNEEVSTVAVLNPKVSTDSCGNVYLVGDSNSQQVQLHDGLADASGGLANNPLLGFFTETFDVNSFNIFVGKIHPNGVWEWVAAVDNSIDAAISNCQRSSVDVDNCGNIYVVGQSNGAQPKFYDAGSNGNTLNEPPLVIGRDTNENSQIFIGKLANDARSAPLIGIAQQPTANNKDSFCSEGNIYVGLCGITNVLSSQYGIGGTFVTNVSFVSIKLDNNCICFNNMSGVFDIDQNIENSGNCGPFDKLVITQFFFPGDNLPSNNTIVSSSQLGAAICYTQGADTWTTYQLWNVVIINNCNVIYTSVNAQIHGLIESGALQGKYTELQFSIVGDLQPGCTYYIDCSRKRKTEEESEPTVHCATLTTEQCAPCCCPNRCVGVACDPCTLIWKPEPPLCHPKQCCCCTPSEPPLLT